MSVATPDIDDDAQDEGMFGRPRSRSRKRRNWPFALLVLLFVAGAMALGAVRWWRMQLDPPGPAGEEVAVEVPEGSSLSGVGDLLAEREVLKSRQGFRIYNRLNDAGEVQAGEYSFRRNSSVEEVMATLKQGPAEVETIRLSVPEGLSLAEIANQVQSDLPGRSAEKFVQVVNSGKVQSKYSVPGRGLEGLMMPDTYEFEADADEEDVLRKLVSQMDARASQLGIEQASSARGLRPYDLITIASLIEREARRDEDRPLVSGVISNRLRSGMPLQLDATVLYALGKPRSGQVLIADTKVRHPYNTYVNLGLPPGPIAAPGEKALQAAISPTAHDFLYYVTVNDCTGETVFARSLDEQNRNVARRRAAPKANC